MGKWQWLKDFGLPIFTVGLVVVTSWYSLATARMASVMAKELRLKTKPRLRALSARATSNGWKCFAVQQEIVNTGLSTLAVESACMEWWAYDMRHRRHRTHSDTALPAVLAPGGSMVVEFKIPETQLACYLQDSVGAAGNVLTGLLRYEIAGVEGRSEEQEYSLAQTDSEAILQA